MQTNAFRSSNVKRRHSILWRYICYGLLLSCIPFLLASVHYMYAEQDNVAQSEQKRFEEAANMTASAFFGYIQSMQSASLSISTNQMLLDKNLGQSTYNDYLAIKELRNYLHVLPFVSDCGLFTDKTPDILYASDGVWYKDIFTRYVLTDDSLFYNTLLNKAGASISAWSEADGMCICAMPLAYAQNGEPSKSVFFLLKRNQLLANLKGYASSISGSTVVGIWNPDEKLIFYNNACGITAAAAMYLHESGLSSVDSSALYFFEGLSNGYTVMLCAPQSSFLALTQAVTSSLRYMLIVDCLLCLVLTFIFVYLNYRPLGKLMQTMGLKYGAYRGNEYRMIEAEYTSRTHRIKELERKIEDQNRFQLLSLFEKALNGLELTSEEKTVIEVILGKRDYCSFVAVVHVTESRTARGIALGSNEGMIFTTRLINDSFLAFICISESVSEYRNMVDAISACVQAPLGVDSVNVGWNHLHSSYLEAIFTLAQSGSTPVYFYSEVPASDHSHEYRDISVVQLARMIKNGDADTVHAINALFDAISISDGTPEMRRYRCFCMIQKLQQSLNKMDMNFTDEQAAKITSCASDDLSRVACIELIIPMLNSIQAENKKKYAELRKGIMDYIQSEIGNVALNIMLVSEKCSVPEYTVSQVLKEATGQSFADYLRSLRLSQSRELLLETKDSIGEIAEKTGFSSSSYFIKVFKSEMGMTPAAYRQAASNSRLLN